MVRFMKIGGCSAIALAAAATLAACHPQQQNQAEQPGNALALASRATLPPLPDAVPMTDAVAGPVTDAPAASALPAAQPIPVAAPAGGADYAYADRAAAFDQVIGNAPPDYSFGYDDGVDPWAWQSGDGYETFAEPIDDGYRYYYYAPGANEPYYVRDPDYGYAYSNGSLVAMYGAGGSLIALQQARAERIAAARDHARGRSLYTASRHRDRRGVSARQWDNRREAIERSRRDDWQRDAARRRAVEQQAQHWQSERRVRQQAATHYADWRRTGEHGAPPHLYDRARADRASPHSNASSRPRIATTSNGRTRASPAGPTPATSPRSRAAAAASRPGRSRPAGAGSRATATGGATPARPSRRPRAPAAHRPGAPTVGEA